MEEAVEEVEEEEEELPAPSSDLLGVPVSTQTHWPTKLQRRTGLPTYRAIALEGRGPQLIGTPNCITYVCKHFST